MTGENPQGEKDNMKLFIVQTSGEGRKTWLADTTERTSPVVAHTYNKEEAVRLSFEEAQREAKQVRGKVVAG